MGPLNASQENQYMSCYSLAMKLIFCEGVAPKAKVRNSGRMVLPDVFKLLQIGKLKKLEPLNAGEKFINSKKMLQWLPNFLIAICFIQSYSTLKFYNIKLEAHIQVEIF